jgi:hypothetical protein
VYPSFANFALPTNSTSIKFSSLDPTRFLYEFKNPKNAPNDIKYLDLASDSLLVTISFFKNKNQYLMKFHSSQVDEYHGHMRIFFRKVFFIYLP